MKRGKKSKARADIEKVKRRREMKIYRTREETEDWLLAHKNKTNTAHTLTRKQSSSQPLKEKTQQKIISTIESKKKTYSFKKNKKKTERLPQAEAASDQKDG
mmetsp:Transcript_29507/g.50959  ORF Transcript_29507/g.50959 Transcript_29507/m.50959 type:complete len:102 (-) Transcript_29507:128-433(-)